MDVKTNNQIVQISLGHCYPTGEQTLYLPQDYPVELFPVHVFQKGQTYGDKATLKGSDFNVDLDDKKSEAYLAYQAILKIIENNEAVDGQGKTIAAQWIFKTV